MEGGVTVYSKLESSIDQPVRRRDRDAIQNRLILALMYTTFPAEDVRIRTWPSQTCLMSKLEVFCPKAVRIWIVLPHRVHRIGNINPTHDFIFDYLLSSCTNMSLAWTQSSTFAVI